MVWGLMIAGEGGVILNDFLFEAIFKEQSKKLLSYAAGTIGYAWLLTGIYPSIKESKAVIEIAESVPSSVKSVFGISQGQNLNSFESFISTQFYNRMWTLLISIYSVSTANALLARLLEEGSLVYPLASPLTRREIYLTQVTIYLTGAGILSGTAMFGIYTGAKIFNISIDVWRYIRLTVFGLAFLITIGAYCFFFSALFNTQKSTLLFGAGLSFFFYGLDIAAGLGQKFEGLRKFTLFTLFKPLEILEGSVPTSNFLICSIISSIFLALGGLIFCQKDLPV